MNIKKTIKDNGWTLESLRAKMQEIEGREVKQSSMSRIVNSANPTVETLQRLADAMQISICSFFENDQQGTSLVCPHCGKPIELEIRTKEGK